MTLKVNSLQIQRIIELDTMRTPEGQKLTVREIAAVTRHWENGGLTGAGVHGILKKFKLQGKNEKVGENNEKEQ